MRLSFKEIPRTTKLYQDFLYNFSRVAEFYSGDYQDDKSYSKVLSEIDKRIYPRGKLVSILRKQNQHYNCTPQTLQNVERLKEPDSCVIFTGQQVGILGGPLYTLYKAISSIKLSRILSEKYKRAFIPMFWMSSFDNDFEEVRWVGIIDKKNDFLKLTCKPRKTPSGESVSKILLDEKINKTIDQIEQTLADTEFKGEVFEKVRSSYKEGETLTTAFGKWLTCLLGELGLVIVDPADEDLRQLAAPVFQREVEEAGESTKILIKTNQRLNSLGYHQQVHKVADLTNIFLDEEKRYRIRYRNKSLVVDEIDKKISKKELEGIIKDTPDRISPNVILKTVIQSFVFPTFVYVGGPGEVSYYAQVKKIFEHFEVPMPIVYPRNSLTLIEDKIKTVLDKYSLSVSEFFKDVEQIINSLMRMTLPDQMEEKLDKIRNETKDRLDSSLKEISSFDPSLEKTVEHSKIKIDFELKKLKEKLFQAHKKKNKILRDQIYKVKNNLFPENKLQERMISIVFFLVKYGFGFIDILYDSININTQDHQILYLAEGKREK